MFEALFLRHPRAIGETYAQHQRAAFRYGGTLLLAGLACLVHGVAPGLFQTSGSRRVARLNAEMGARMASADPAAWI